MNEFKMKFPKAAFYRLSNTLPGEELDKLFLAKKLPPDDEITADKAANGFTSWTYEACRDTEGLAATWPLVHFLATKGERSAPTSAVKAQTGHACALSAAERGLDRLPKKERVEIKREVERRLAKNAPVTYTHTEVVADFRKQAAIATATADSSAMLRVAELLHPHVSFAPVGPEAWLDERYDRATKEPFAPSMQTEMSSRRSEAGAEFLTWVAARNALFNDSGMFFATTPAQMRGKEGATVDLDNSPLFVAEFVAGLRAGKLVSELSVAINVADGSVYAARIDKDFTLRQVSVPIPEETENEAEVRRLAGFAALGAFFRLVKERFELWLALRLDAEKWLKETALIRTAVGRASR
jgi:hypothetical protein